MPKPKLLYGLPWGFPNWLGSPDNQNVLTNNGGTDAANYIVNWIECANRTHGLHIDVIGVWNEMDDQFEAGGVAYLKLLRKVLDARGFGSTKIIAGDVHSWAPSTEVLKDPELAKVVDILCRHYPSTKSDAAAVESGKPLWSSEDYAADNTDDGGRCQGRILNQVREIPLACFLRVMTSVVQLKKQNFVNGNMTATISWNLISSYYSWLQWANDGLMMARTPWSGHYTVSPPIWAIAHTCQFASPGWSMLPVGQGSGTLAKGGTFVTYVDGGSHLKSSASGEFALVIEKIVPMKSSCGFSQTPHYEVVDETASFKLPTAMHKALLARNEGKAVTLVLWRSNYQSEQFFIKDNSGIPVAADGSFSVTVKVDDLITVASPTTGNKAMKGTFPNVPADNVGFPGNFTADFDGPEFVVQAEAPFFAQMTGAFEVHAAASNSSADFAHGQTLRQNGVGFPVKWLRDDILPYTQLGDNKWSDASISADVMIEESGSAYIATRWVGSDTAGKGFLLGIDIDKQLWFLAPSVEVVKARTGYLTQGHMAVSKGTWYTLSLTIDASHSISGTLDGKPLFEPRAIPAGTPNGNVALGTGQYNHVQFDNVAVRATSLAPTPAPPPAPTPAPPPEPPAPSKCTDPKSGTDVHVKGCLSNPKDRVQAWHFNQPSDGTIALAAKGFDQLCLAVSTETGHGCSGKCVVLGSCSSAPKWQFDSTTSNKIVLVTTQNPANTSAVYWPDDTPQCLEVDLNAPPSGYYNIDLNDCNDDHYAGQNQMFDFDQATGIVSSELFNSMATCIMAC